jgi:hypothetical protein
MIRPSLFLFLIEFPIENLGFFVILLKPVDSFLYLNCIIDGWCPYLRERETFLRITFCNHRFEVDRRWEKASTMLLFDRPVVLYKRISTLYRRNQRLGDWLYKLYRLKNLIHFPNPFLDNFFNLISLII